MRPPPIHVVVWEPASEQPRERTATHGKYTFYRVMSSWDTRCYSLIPSKRSKYKKNRLRESGENRSSLEMSKNSWFAWQTCRSRFFVCSFVFNIQQAKYLNAKMFIIVWIKLGENLNIYLVTILTKAKIIIIIIIINIYIYIYIYRSVALGFVLLAEFVPLQNLIEEPWPTPKNSFHKHILVLCTPTTCNLCMIV